MGTIGDFANSGFGKAIKWTMLGTTLIGAAGVGQQAAIYQQSKDPGADVFELVKTDADTPTISKTDVLKNFEYKTDVSEGEGAIASKDSSDGKTFNLNVNIPGVPTEDTSASSIDTNTSQPLTPRAKQDLRGMEDVQVRIPSETFQKVISTLEEIPESQKKMNKTTAEVDSQIESMVETSRNVDGSQLATVRVPLPVGEESILQMKIPNVFSGDFYKAPTDINNNWSTVNPLGTSIGSVIEQELPMSISYNMDVGAPDVQVQSKMVNLREAPKPPSDDKPFVYLTSVDTTVTPMASEMHIKGNVNVDLDLNGQHTQKKIDQLVQITKNASSTPAQVQRATQQMLQLNNRMRESQQLDGKLQDAGLRDVINDVMKDQNSQIDLQVKFKEGQPLGKAMSHFFLGPDRDNDGKADIYITQELDLSGFENIKTGKLEMQSPGQKDKGIDGRLTRAGNEFAEQIIHKEAKKAIKGMEGDLKELVKHSLEKVVTKNLPQVEQLVNQRVMKMVNENSEMTRKVNEGDGLFKMDLNARLTGMKVVEQGGKKFVVVGIDTDGKTDSQIKSEFTQYLQKTQANAEAGDALAIVDGHMVNQLLKDQKDGGSVDWSKAFDKAKENKSVESIEFNKDDQGNTVYPKIIMKDGKPFVNVDMTVTLQGVGIVEGAGDIATGATGLLDDGAKAITDGTVGQLGDVGKAAGAVIRSPFWLLNKVAGGAKTIVDNTVGVVVDAIPKEATGSKINVNVSVPLNISTENGDVNVKAVSQGIEVKGSRYNSETSVRDIIPTRLLVSGIAQLVAEGSPETAMGSEKPLVEQKVGVTQFGMNLEKVTFEAGSKDKACDTIPNIQIHLSPNQNLQNTVAGAMRGN